MTEQQLITQIFTAQCHQDFDESTTSLRELFALLTNRIKEFKQHPKFGKVLQENFEILPQSNLISLVQCTPDEDQNRYQKYLQSYCCQSEENKAKKKYLWSDEERKLFNIALKQYPLKNWKQIAQIVKTRSAQQCRSYYEKENKKKIKSRM